MVLLLAFRGIVSVTASQCVKVPLLFSFLLVLIFTPPPLLARVWTDSSGTHRTEADLIEILDQSVQLRTSDGRDIEVPILKLSAEDQLFVKEEQLKLVSAEERLTTEAEGIKDPKLRTESKLDEGKQVPTDPDQPKTEQSDTAHNSVAGSDISEVNAITITIAFTIISLVIAAGVLLFMRFVSYLWHLGSGSRPPKIKPEHVLIQVTVIKDKLRKTIQEKFLVQPCSRCHEFSMQFIDVSPNARSVQYQCLHCGKRSRAAAVSPDSSEFLGLSESLAHAVYHYNSISKSPMVESPIEFRTAPAPLPYEQTQRSPISEAVRSEVWRRDRGCCVTCGSNANIQYDHIIPVSRGGAT